MSLKSTPQNGLSKEKDKTEAMFDGIAGKYDFLNHFLSAGTDIIWRKNAIQLLGNHRPRKILDVATGTADLAIAASRLNPEKITGIDLSDKMLEIGQKKLIQKNLGDHIELIKGDAENLPFESNYFDAVIVGFGVRNFENLEKGLLEMKRVLKEGGVVIILEFSNPTHFPIKQLYHFYFKAILPSVGKLVSKHRSAYSYLPQSVLEFPDGNDMIEILQRLGYKHCQFKPQTMGIATIYSGIK